MKSLENKIQDIDFAFDSLFKNIEEDYDNEAKVIASKILSEVDFIIDKKKLTRKKVAELIGTSASYLTQIYRGNKLLNFTTLAKLKKKLDFNIEIKVTENSYSKSNSNFNYKNYLSKTPPSGSNENWQCFRSFGQEIKEPIKDQGCKFNEVKQQLTA